MKKLSFLFAILVLIMSFTSQAKVLDIIVGGSNAGLECKTDEECGPGKYCNQEQYYCTACKVPPKVWTGTECKCPAGLVDKSDTECVQCLTDDNCAAKGDEMFCNTDTYACVQCKEPKEWKDNACACPAKTHEAGDNCICDNPNTNLDEFNFCACTLTPASCATTELNLTECMCCPIERPVTIGNECKTCAAIDPSKPVWDSVTKTCVECKSNTNCPVNKPICKTDTNTCVQCVETNNCAVNQYCNNMTCSTCPSNQVRPAGEQNCRCPDNLPIWDGSRCVQCTTNWNCPANQYCSYGNCIGCPVYHERPTNEENCRCVSNLPFWDGTKCVQCTQNSQCGGNNVCINNTCKPFTCQNVGWRASGLRITAFDPSRDMSGNPHLGGIWDNGSSMGSSRKDCNDGRVVGEGILYAARAGTYSFRVMGGDWGESEVKLWMDNGQLVYSGRAQNPGIAYIWLSEGAHGFTYEGWIRCRRNMTFQYDSTYVKACTNR